MKKKNEITRLLSIVQNDRLNLNDQFHKIIEKDVEKVLKEYFDYNDNINIEITKNGDGYRVNFSFFATRIKPFIKSP